MNNNTLKSVVNKARQRRYIKRGLALLCVFVLLLTMNTLKRNANTLERVPMCGYAEEHVHMPECYDGDALVCGRAEHIHTDACYQEVPGDGDEMNVQLADTPVEDLDSENLDGLLSLSEDDFALVTDDVAPAQPVSNATEAQPKAFILGEGTMVSRIIDVVGLDVSLAAIINVAVVDDATMQADAVGIEKDGDDYRIFATRDFDRAQLALVVEGDILLVDLLDGVAVRETSDAPAEIAEETAPAAPVAEEIMPVIEESPVEDSPAGEVIEEQRIDLPEPAQEAQEATPAAEADETGDITLAEDAQPVEGEIIETGEQPAEDEAAETEEEPAEDGAVETGEQSADEEAAETEGEPAEDKAAETEEEPAEDEVNETGEEPAEDEAAETEEESAEDEASENEEQLVEDEVNETGEQSAEDEVTETGEQPAEDEASETEEQPVEGEVSETEEQTAEEDTPETEEQPIEEEATETGEQPVEDEASGTEEQSDEAEASTEEVADEGQAIYTATVDLAEVTDYPLSLNALLAGFAPENEAQAEETPEPAGEDGTEAKPNEAPAGASALSIEYDHDLLDIEAAGDDYLITPVASFESTAIVVDNGSRYELTLVNYALSEAGGAVEAEPEARVGYPAQNFEGHTRYVKVVVAAPEGAFPEGTTMAVADVEDEKTLTDIEDTVSEEFVEVKRVHAVDITFRDAEGNEIEPLMPISVVMTVDEIGQRQEAVVVHVDDAGAAEVVDSQSEAPAGETEVKVEMPATEAPEAAQPEDSEAASVGFDADSFSVYAVVITETIDTKYIDAEGATWNISVGYGPEAGIPAGATLAVQEVEGDYLEQTTELLRGKETITLARFFDITILDAEGNAVQPAQPVEVKATLAEQSEDAVKAVHFAEDGPEIIEASQEEDAVSFDAASFSVYGIVYTVDFHYTANGRIFGYGIPGGDCASLRALLPALNVASDDPETEADELEAFMAGIADVKFTDSELVRVCPVTAETTVGALRAELGLESQYSAALTEADRAEIDARVLTAPDWALFSLLPFTSDEALTVTMENGDSFIIVVTDAQIATRVLASDGNTYKITLTFGPEAEIPLDAQLKAVEIERSSDAWFDYAVKAMEALGSDAMNPVSCNRFFDIEILSNGEKIEPKAVVTVSIALEDAPDPAENELKVVHFVEDGPVVVPTRDGDESADVCFEAESFSVYGVITADRSAPTGVNDLDGRAFTISRGSGKDIRYLTSNIVPVNGCDQFMSQDKNGTVWVFEKDASHGNGQYYIYTYKDGKKMYMHLEGFNDQKAQAGLSETPQTFTVNTVNDSNYAGCYTLSVYDKKATNNDSNHYYLNEFGSSDGSHGYCGWWYSATENDYVNLNFVTSSSEQQYILVTKYEGEYYVILNDGTLVRTDDPNVQQIMAIDAPMAWTYNGNNLYHDTKETGFDGSQLAYDYFYRYMNPDVAQGYTDENYDNTSGELTGYASEYKITDRPLKREIIINYNDHRINSRNNPSNYIGIVAGEDGKLHIAGKQGVDSAAEIYFVKMINESAMTYNEAHHTVNHIDISVVGRAAFSVPLSNGRYYYKDDDGHVHELVVTRDNPVEIDVEQEVPIDREDVKRANITAYTKDANGVHHSIDDAFYISGYAGNDSTSISTNQTRIEGIFKVADMDAIDPKDSTKWVTTTDENQPFWDASYHTYPTDAVLGERLQHQIYYTVSTTKKVSYDLKYNNYTLYQSREAASAGGEDGVCQGSATVTFSNSFSYWDLRNECPPIHIWGGGRTYWEKGGILYAGTEKQGSGMDFALGTIEKDKNGIRAIEITKYIIDKAGNAITPRQDVNSVFHIYHSADSEHANANEVVNLNVGSYNNTDYVYDGKGYTHIHDKIATVADGGIGTVYDYDLEEGMYYIQEDTSERNLPRDIVDIQGKNWHYVETHLETEYVWRDNGIENRRHISKTYNDLEEAYNSVPEVLGSYTDAKGVDRDNGYLEYHVYNVYDVEPVDISVKKNWKHKDNDTDAEAPEGASVMVTLGRYKLTEDLNNPISGNLTINHDVKVKTDGNGERGLTDGDHYYAIYKVMQNGRTIRSGTFDYSNPSITLASLPSGDNYTLVISESMNGFTASTRMNGKNTTRLPVVIEAGRITQVNAVTKLTTAAKDKMVNVTIKNELESNLNYYYQQKNKQFPANSRIVITVYRPNYAYKGSGFWAKYDDGSGAKDFPWPENDGNTNWTYVYQDWEYQLGDQDVQIIFNHNWGQENFFIQAVTVKSGSSASTGSDTPQGDSNLQSAMPGGSIPTTQIDNVGVTGSEPESDIPGMIYVDDETWSTEDDPVMVKLANGVWEDVVTGLEATDNSGHAYLYYIRKVDETGMPEGTVVTIDTDGDGKVLTSTGDTTLSVTNRIPDEKPKITIRKVDENGQPLPGASFKLSGNGSEKQTIKIDDPDATKSFTELEEGAYEISEIVTPDGYKTINGTIKFNVNGMSITNLQDLPEGVEFDDGSYTFTVKNSPIVTDGHLKIVKRWQDFYGNALSNPPSSAKMKLVQMVKKPVPKHMVTVKFFYRGNGDGSDNYPENYYSDNPPYTSAASRVAMGRGTATIQWRWDKYTKIDYPTHVIITGLDDPRVDVIDTDKQFKLTIPDNGSSNIAVYVYVENSNYDPFNDGDGWIGTIEGLTDDSSELSDTYVTTGGTKEITLTAPEWSQEFSYSGDGLLSNSSADLPAAFQGKPCVYTIVEEDVDTNYSVSYSENNTDGLGPGSTGTITAYNRKRTADVKLVKVDRLNREVKLNGACFVLYRLDESQPGGVRMGDPIQTVFTAGNGEATFKNLGVGYYEIEEVSAPTNYVIKPGEASFYIKVTPEGVFNLEKDENQFPAKWSRRANDSRVAMNGGNTFVVGNDMVSLEIVKVDANGMTTKLAGAGFELYEITGPGTAHGSEPILPETIGENHLTGTNGKAEFKRLKNDCYYMVRESVVPDGYVLTDSREFYILVKNGTASLVEWSESNREWAYKTENAKLTFETHPDDASTTVTVGNDMGVSLPNTGGSGTTPYYVFGSLLALVAAAMLVARRRGRA